MKPSLSMKPAKNTSSFMSFDHKLKQLMKEAGKEAERQSKRRESLKPEPIVVETK